MMIATARRKARAVTGSHSKLEQRLCVRFLAMIRMVMFMIVVVMVSLFLHVFYFRFHLHFLFLFANATRQLGAALGVRAAIPATSRLCVLVALDGIFVRL